MRASQKGHQGQLPVGGLSEEGAGMALTPLALHAGDV